MYKMKKIILTLILGILLINLTGATVESLGIFKQGECIELPQTCADCTYNNISSVSYPNSSIAISNVRMTKDDTDYNYSFCLTATTGNYIVRGYGDPEGIKTIWTYDFEVTPSGITQNSILENPILIILFALSLIFLGLGVGFKISSLGFVGSVLLVLSGIYTMIYGFNNVTNIYTRGVAITLLGLGIIFMFISAYEWLPWGKEE